MKRLLDETTDDFTRALLVAGIEQRPPAGNKRRVLIALGAGSALGLFSSQALAWLGTSGGKLSLLGVALGMAGAVYAVDPWSETQGSSPAAPSPAALAETSPREPRLLGGPAVVPEEGNDGVALQGVGPDTGALPVVTTPSEPSSTSEARARAARVRGERDGVVPASKEPRRDGPPPTVAAPTVAAPTVSTPEVGTPGEVEPVVESASLDAEVRLVDDMHWAARRNDREALARFVATYHASFPDGQLKEEVSAFAARLARPTTP